MTVTIEEATNHFKRRVKIALRANLGNYFGSPQVIGKSANDSLELTIPGLFIPRFQYVPADNLIVGSDEKQQPKHLVSIDDLLDLAAQELNWKQIIPGKITERPSAERDYGAVSRQGPEARRNFKKTFKRALLRHIAAKEYNSDAEIHIRNCDRRYHAPQTEDWPSRKAVIINIKTPAKTIREESMERILTFNAWSELWIRRAYGHVATEYIVHKNTARAVNQQEYTAIRGRGKMRISSAYLKCLSLILDKYQPSSWDAYLFQFGDGQIQKGNEGEALSLLQRWLIPRISLFGYGQVVKDDEEHHFYKKLLLQNLGREPKLRCFGLSRKEQIYPALGTCFSSRG